MLFIALSRVRRVMLAGDSHGTSSFALASELEERKFRANYGDSRIFFFILKTVLQLEGEN